MDTCHLQIDAIEIMSTVEKQDVIRINHSIFFIHKINIS